MANLIKRGDIYYAEVRIPNDVKSIFSKSVFRRSTGCKDRRNAELEAAPWISSWWKEIKEARTNPDQALEKIAALMARHYEEDLRGISTGTMSMNTLMEFLLDVSKVIRMQRLS